MKAKSEQKDIHVTQLKDWTEPDEAGMINVPDELIPLFNKIGHQFRLHTISGKNEVLSIAHCVWNAEQFFQARIEYWEKAAIDKDMRVAELISENERLKKQIMAEHFTSTAQPEASI